MSEFYTFVSNGAILHAKLLISGLLCIAALAAVFWIANTPAQRTAPASPGQAANGPVLRLGLAPEQDIFTERKAYRTLADYLERKFSAAALAATSGSAPPHPTGDAVAARSAAYRVELLTAASYAGVLQDFQEGKIDAAFLGSLTTALAVDRCGAQVLLKPESESGTSTHCSAIFVLNSSRDQLFDDLRNKRLGGVRTTFSGAVFPLFLMKQAGMLETKSPADAPQLVWCGTYEDVIREVVAGNLNAGAVKDLRLLEYRQEHPEVGLRVLAQSEGVPDNALVVRRDLPAPLRESLVNTLLAMNGDPEAVPALAALKIKRFLPCKVSEYSKLYDVIEGLGTTWDQLKIPGPVPQRPATARSATNLPAHAGGG